MSNITGKILKSVGGFFHVESLDGVLLCTARGVFRHKDITPVAGDNVVVDTGDICENTPVITDVLERKNHIIRPPLANLDAAIIVVSTVEPKPNRLILDKLIAIFESKEIEPVLLFTKTDKKEEEELRRIYEKAGFTVFSVNNTENTGTEAVRDFVQNKTCALIGNTGVGKSSTLNNLFPGFKLETAEISKKLGRGKHTTRQVELFGIDENSYIADTPGFSTVEAAKYGELISENVALYFREFVQFLDKCRFAGCSHTKEEGCAVINAKESGKINAGRFENYVRIYKDAWAEERSYN
ncbi:MAG: ribosome small subunit-dependent GTPase A [Oscillospiraceae bacterium]|nr:ribosome small subunit-dependent GTPase A [Oscillospiraceae bacterium]